MSIIQERLIEAITLSGLTLTDIAKKVGVSISVISNYKRSKKMPSLETFAVLCKVLDVSSDYILGLAERE